ncbi:MAG: restriction endonuclease [Pirellulales bacterium]|nr:restriction endonuclease [Pirellulales bacterium]
MQQQYIQNENIQFWVESTSPSLFRLIWWNHIDPSKRKTFHDDFFEIILSGITRTYENKTGTSLALNQRVMIKAICLAYIKNKLGKIDELLPKFEDTSFERITNNIVEHRHSSDFHEVFAKLFDDWTSRIDNLSSLLIKSLNKISEEYLIWLKSHPEDLDKIHWQAFEKLTAEILASHGLRVQMTGQVKNKSSDIIAIEFSEMGITTKHLVECKRYAKSNKVDLSIINAVLGAK